ncbi:MAG: amidohydrolase [Spirochaetales bacterium]|nr:amidohydrolase [Spirochaetales bacterium]
MDYLESAKRIESDLDAIRQDLHRHPELGNSENRTSDKIESMLKGMGLNVKRILGTALVATLHGRPSGRKVALRADMDALPVTETTGCPYSSVNQGLMHACGHDIHMTAALGAAMLLSGNRDALNGDVVFLFQPDEEGNGGAQRMIEAGVLEGVSAVFGGHVAPDLPLGTFGFRYGKFYAASDVITVTVHGKSCHGATPEKGRNALLAAAEMVTALSRLHAPNNDRCVFSIGQLISGTAGNIIADKAVFTGMLRTLGPENRDFMKKAIRDTVAAIDARFGVSSEVDIHDSYGGVVNTDAETRLFEQTSRKLFGDDCTRVLDEPTMTTEDFGYFIDACSGSFCHIGAGCTEPLHSSCFLPDVKAAVYAAALYAQTVETYLK